METMREDWTDERLDDLNGGLTEFRLESRQEFGAVREEMRREFGAVRHEMKEEFRAVRDEMKEEFRAVRREMKEEFSAVRGEMQQEFGSLHARFDGLQQTMIQFGALMIAALIGLIATQL